MITVKEIITEIISMSFSEFAIIVTKIADDEIDVDISIKTESISIKM